LLKNNKTLEEAGIRNLDSLEDITRYPESSERQESSSTFVELKDGLILRAKCLNPCCFSFKKLVPIILGIGTFIVPDHK